MQSTTLSERRKKGARKQIMYRPTEINSDCLATLGNCGGYYSCPKDGNGSRLGPLVGYAGKYDDLNCGKLQFVGDVYANFAMAEKRPDALEFFAGRILQKIVPMFPNIRDEKTVLCGAPIGGYALATAIGLRMGWQTIKAEKKVTELATSSSREKSKLVFARHSIEAGLDYVIVEDVCNNFSTTAELISLITSAGGNVLAIACFLNRSPSVEGEYLLSPDGYHELRIPVVALVRKVIPEYRQDDPAVAEDIARSNVVWKPKDEWPRLMEAMRTHPELSSLQE
jgi:adenine/guanine phosphoribosyltransferase-like PRPP-binding protein